jgi:hypothetical protein
MPPHRFRISLRDILWLTLLLGALVAALHSHDRDSRQLSQLRDWYSRSCWQALVNDREADEIRDGLRALSEAIRQMGLAPGLLR